MALPVSAVRRLSDYHGMFVLSILCKACQHERMISAPSLAKVYGRDARVGPLVKRLRCSKCRKRDVEVWIVGIPR